MKRGSDFIPNGLLSSKAPSVAKVLDQDRWSQAEARTAELLAHIQPNQTSEGRRNAVVSYLRCLIMDCVPCQVFTVGSVPLKTYLPDGDIDLTAFGDNQHSEDSLVQDVMYTLEREEKNEDAEFHVKEVQYIEAEVKIIKCLVENFVVDISFNQIGGLGTLCFLEEVDYLIKQNHLFKRSIILIKAWCFYESRILGSHHGLISTYAVETLVIYLFHVYSNTFAGPLEVLLRFLDFFSKFDWSKYCVSLRGPVPISSLPNMKAEPPRKNCQPLLLSKQFLYVCESSYGVMPSSQELKEKPFVSKYLNIVDPLRANNNLGRSIHKGNFCRIKSAIAFGAKQIERLLDCPEDNLIAEFDLFFKNTWDRNGNGYWLDTRSYNLYIRKNNVTSHESEVKQAQASHGIYQNPANHSEESKQMFGNSYVSAASQTWSSRNNGIFTGTMTSDIEHTNTMKNALDNRGQSPIYSSHEVYDMHHFPGFYTGSEFAHLCSEAPTQHYHNTRISSENQQSFGQISYDWRNEYAFDPEDTSSGYYYENGFGANDENVFPVDEVMLMHQKEHNFPNFNEYLKAPVNVNSNTVSFPPPPTQALASGYMHENSFGVLPENVPSFESFSGHNMPCSQDTAPFPSEWFPSLRSTFYEEELTEPVDYNVLVPHSDHVRQMAVNSGSNSGNSSWETGATIYTPKDYVVTTNQNWLTREKNSGDPPHNRIINKDVNSRARSSFKSALLSTSRTGLSSPSFSSGSSLKTPQPDGVSRKRIGRSTIGTGLRENTSTEAITSYVQALQLGRKVPMTVPNSSVSDHTPVHVAPPGSSQRAVDNRRLFPIADGSSGPSFQVPTMFPFHNVPTETETTFAATNDEHMVAELGNLYPPEPNFSLDSTQHVNHTNHDAAHSGYFVKEGSDILEGDFESYWVNLQYGRFCKNPQSQGPLANPPSITPSMRSRGQFPWYRKPTGVMNSMGHVHTPVPVMPSRRVSPLLHGDAKERVGFWIPRFSEGTGTYLPNSTNYHLRFYRRKGHQKNRHIKDDTYEMKDNHGEREENSHLNSMERFPSPGQFYDNFENPGSNESSPRGESSQSGISTVANFGRDSKSTSTSTSIIKNPWGSTRGTPGQ
ncbi:Poly(A) RNA polymerase cid14 [Spatholobus suberectus]|nr:Poly(A) RNA polymerase cid14 [Spatholobus suberectus]